MLQCRWITFLKYKNVRRRWNSKTIHWSSFILYKYYRLRNVYDVQICTKSTFSVRHGKLKYYSIVQGRTIENMSRAV